MFIKTYNNKKNIAGTLIKKAREAKGMSKVALSKKLELYGVSISRNELLKIEKNELMVKDFELAAISETLNIDLNNLKNYLDN